MQRIDENTYIDDTLVTCAEYQLFIDEMREQGKYYQPDHWTSYQFPAGQAREPILGVRHSDAIVFCEWLTQHEERDFLFRLPNSIELDKCSNLNLNYLPIGIWANNNKDHLDFYWLGDCPDNARSLSHTEVLTHAKNLIHSIYHEDKFAFEIYKTRLLTESDDKAIKKVLDSIHNRDRSNTNEIEFSKNLTCAAVLLFDLARNTAYNNNIDILDAAKLAIDRNINHGITLVQDFWNNLEKTLDFYVDLITLQERIAGRSPAFEGIRLVKERTR